MASSSEYLTHTVNSKWLKPSSSSLYHKYTSAPVFLKLIIGKVMYPVTHAETLVEPFLLTSNMICVCVYISLIAQLVKKKKKKNHLQCSIPCFHSWVRKILWRKDRLPTPVFLGFPCGSAGKDSVCSVGDLGSTPGLGRSPGKRKGYLLQYSGLENSMDHIVHGVPKSRTWLSNFHFHLHTHTHTHTHTHHTQYKIILL